MPHQQFDENMDRVACQRRCEEDDQWLNPHNWYLAMFSPSTIHVLPFDPHHGNDNARVYAGKYASNPEKAPNHVCSYPLPLSICYVLYRMHVGF